MNLSTQALQRNMIMLSEKTEGRVALFFQSIRNLNTPQLYRYLSDASAEDIVDCFAIVLHIRDCRGGKGERLLGRTCMTWLFVSYPDHFLKIFPLVARYGRWDDIIHLWPGILPLHCPETSPVQSSWWLERCRINYCAKIKDEAALVHLHSCQRRLVRFFGEQLAADKAAIEAGREPSLCAKWAPTERGSLDRRFGLVKVLCAEMGWTQQKYRTGFVAPIRRHLSIVETLICSNKWNAIHPDRVPKEAWRRLKKTFDKRNPELLSQRSSHSRTSNNRPAMVPHEIIRDVRAQKHKDYTQRKWDSIRKTIRELGTFRRSVCVVDVSGSMSSWNLDEASSYCPMDVAIGIGLMVSGVVSGPFRNRVITCGRNPTLIRLRGDLHARWRALSTSEWGGELDLKTTLNLVLERTRSYETEPAERPQQVVIITDKPARETTIPNAEDFASHGYDVPRILYWNLCGSRGVSPTAHIDGNFTVIQGFSPAILQALLTGTDCRPYQVLRSTIDTSRYRSVFEALRT